MCLCSGTSKNDIISQIAGNKKFINELKKISPKEYSEDVIQDLFLRFLEVEPEQKFVDLCKNNQMKFYIIRCLIRQMYPNKTKRYKSLNGYNMEAIDDEDYRLIDIPLIETDWNTDAISNIVKKELDKMNFYDRQIFELVTYSGKTFKELSEQINIADYNIYYTFNKVRVKLRNKLKKIDLT